MKAFFLSYKTTFLGILGAISYAICSGAGKCLVNGQVDDTCIHNLIFSACILGLGTLCKDADKTGPATSTNTKGPGAVLLTMLLLLSMSVFSQSGVIPANGVRGSININYNPQGNPGNTGDVQVSFNGAKASVSGFNFNPFTSTLLIDSLPATPVPYYFSADTTVAGSKDTTFIPVNYRSVGTTTANASMLNYVIVLPYTPVPVTPYPQNNFFVTVQFTGKIQALKILSWNGKVYSVLYSGITVQPGQVFSFWNNSGTWE